MELLELLKGLPIRSSRGTPEPIRGVAFDSRQVHPGDVFVCIPGSKEDGHDYAVQAVAAGAAALVVERALDLDVPQVVVADCHRALGFIASRWHGVPGAALNLIGVTGTNGKTTITYMLESIFKQAGERVGRIGTVTVSNGEREWPALQTTPDPLSLQSMLADMRKRGLRWVAMEVSSHALTQERVLGCPFRYGLLTNVTRDHFDYHRNFWQYARAKARLFAPRLGPAGDETTRTAIVHHRYTWVTGRRFTGASEGEGVGEFYRYGVRPEDDFWAEDLLQDERGSHFTLRAKGVSLPLFLPMPGQFNVENAVAAAATALHAGVEGIHIQEALAAFRFVPGRVQTLSAGQPYTVLVDFAHNPAGLRAVLSIPVHRPGAKKIIVFGAEGEKDKGKRPLMGQVVSEMADVAIVTSDNPHGEDPESIARDVAAGWKPGGCPYQIVVDREEAILTALLAAQPGDLVVIAGKGHETALVGREGSRPFSDTEVAERLLRQLGRKARASSQP